VNARPRARLLFALLPAAAALGCNGMTNGNHWPTPMGGTTGGMPMGTVAITIAAPVDGMPPVFPGTVIDVSAHITVEGGSDFIDGSSVEVTLSKQGSNEVVEKGKLVITAGDQYDGRLSLPADLVGGTYTVTITARSSGGAVGSQSVNVTVDGGPVIIINAPVEGKSYKRMLTIEVVASDGVGLATDANGVVIPPAATVGVVPVPLSPTGVDNTYRGTIDFDAQDPPMFGSQLLTVSVSNINGRRTEKQLIFIIDNEGPMITNTEPVPGQIAAGIVMISATVNDNAGILDSSVIAVIADETGTPLFELPMKPAGNGVYTVLFDSSRFVKCSDPPDRNKPCLVFPTVSFRAADLVGNETVLGYAFALDNVAPIADLDSANVRAVRRDGYCSREFDPLALNTNIGDMPNDKAVVPQVFDLRARIEDDGNSAVAGLKGTPVAGVDPEATNVYILDDATQPLIVDVDGDGVCDVINPKLIPTTKPPTQNNQVLKVRLAGVPGQGDADYRDDGKGAADCPYPPVALPPLYVCPGNQPFMTISGFGNVPMIWSVEPINKAWCMGYQFDTRANNIGEGTGAGDPTGWACMAVQSSDMSGNTSVSPPMRIYIRYGGAGAGAPAPASYGTPPACTGIYDKNSDTVMPGACSTRRFGSVTYILNPT
jgi:hypothetical protein